MWTGEKKKGNHYCLYYSAIPLHETSTSTRTQTVQCARHLGSFVFFVVVSFEGKDAVLAPSLQKTHTYTPVAMGTESFAMLNRSLPPLTNSDFILKHFIILLK